MRFIFVSNENRKPSYSSIYNYLILLKNGIFGIPYRKFFILLTIKYLNIANKISVLVIYNKPKITSEFCLYLKYFSEKEKILYGDSLVEANEIWYESRPIWSPILLGSYTYLGDVIAYMNFDSLETISYLKLEISEGSESRMRRIFPMTSKLDFAISRRKTKEYNEFNVPILYDFNLSANKPGPKNTIEFNNGILKFSVIIPTAFAEKSNRVLVRNCIESIITLAPDCIFEFILVTNNYNLSLHDHWIKELKKLTDIKIIELNGVFNFSRAVNYGIERSKFELLLLINDDIELINAFDFKHLVEHLSSDEVGCVGINLIYPDGLIQHSGIIFRNGLVENNLRGTSMQKFPIVLQNCREVTGVTGAFVLSKKSVIQELGGFSEDFPLNFGDVEFMCRLNRKQLTVILCNRNLAIHLESQSQLSIKENLVKLEYERLLNVLGSVPEKDPYLFTLADRKIL